MDKEQFATLATGIKSAYPASKILEDNASMDFWYAMLNDIPYEIANNAVMEHVSTNIYPPSIAEIRKLCVERYCQPVLSFDEAWGVVQRAKSEYGSYHPQDTFKTMDEVTLSVVKNLGWNRLCKSENPAADRANFREAYEAKAKTAMISSLLPEFVAHDKALLQKKYVPVIDVMDTPKIEGNESADDVGDKLTEEQLAKRARMVEEVSRRLFGG